MRDLNLNSLERDEQLNDAHIKSASSGGNSAPVWIGIQGGDCAGKTSLASALADNLGSSSTLIIELDTFYLPVDRSSINDPTTHSFDHPSSLDWNLVKEVSKDLSSCQSTRLPIYDYVTGLRTGWLPVESPKFIVVNGLWAFDKVLIDLYRTRVFVDTAPEIRLVRRLQRELTKQPRGWSVNDALIYYVQCIRPSFKEFTEPGQGIAHVIVSGEESIEIGVAKILQALGTSA